MTCTTLILILLNVLFWLMAFCIIAVRYDKKLSDSWKPMNAEEYVAYSVFVNIFEIQYALNFFVYIYRSPQYRSAFLDLFNDFAYPHLDNSFFKKTSFVLNKNTSEIQSFLKVSYPRICVSKSLLSWKLLWDWKFRFLTISKNFLLFYFDDRNIVCNFSTTST